jgi:hypothetical protein
MNEEGEAITIGVPAARAHATAASVDIFVGKSVAWASEGFFQAVERFSDREAAGRDPSHALAEAVMWLDVLAKEKPELLATPIVKAMTFARARNHHWLASLIETQDDSPWRWRPASLFRVTDPKYANERGERAYESVLAGRAVRDTLVAASSAVRAAVLTPPP